MTLSISSCLRCLFKEILTKRGHFKFSSFQNVVYKKFYLQSLGVALCFLFFSCEQKQTEFDGIKNGIVFKVLFKKPLSSADLEVAKSITEKTFAEIHSTLNGWNEKSEITAWNLSSSTEPIPVSPLLHEMVTVADRANVETDGAFDPSLGKAIRLWKMHLRIGNRLSEEEIANLKESCGWDKVIIHEGALQKKHPEVELDFDGISKGFFCDILTKRLREAGFSNFLVTWGGEVKAFGGPFKVFDGEKILMLSNNAIATSGPAFQCFPIFEEDRSQKFYSHFINPQTLRPSPFTNPYVHKSVLNYSCALADAIATSAFTQSTSKN